MGRSLFILATLAAAILIVRRVGRGDEDLPGALHGWPWLVLGLGVQLLWVRFISRQGAVPSALHWLPSLALLPALWFVWTNRRYRGLWVLAAGASLNLLVMAANGGLMPISPTSLHALGAIGSGGRADSERGMALAMSKDRTLADSTAHLAYLDDRLVLAASGLHIACSLGDLLVVVGCLATLCEGMWRGAHPVRVRGAPVVA